MKRTVLSFLAALALAVPVIAPTPALADDGFKDMTMNTVLFPVKAVGIGAGMVVGIPVAITRRASSRSMEFTDTFADKIGGHEHIPPRAMASLAGIPFGILVGTGEGVYYGGKNAISNCDKPFSLESFSLGSELTD